MCGASRTAVGNFKRQCRCTGWLHRIYTGAEPPAWAASEHLQEGGGYSDH